MPDPNSQVIDPVCKLDGQGYNGESTGGSREWIHVYFPFGCSPSDEIIISNSEKKEKHHCLPDDVGQCLSASLVDLQEAVEPLAKDKHSLTHAAFGPAFPDHIDPAI
jgi:hypothetical protein